MTTTPLFAGSPDNVSSLPTSSEAQDQAAITTIIESVGTFADRGEFGALEQLYAPEVMLDYTSLAGGEPETVSNVELMTRWAGILPGFDRTRHAIDEIVVVISGDSATATAAVVADHWVGSLHWQVRGNYTYAFERTVDGWAITAHRFEINGESGTREVFDAAGKAADDEPAPYLRRQRSQAIVRQFLVGLEAKDMDQVNAVWAEDAVQEMPFAPRGVGFPNRVEGREALLRRYSGWPQNALDPDYTSELRFLPSADPDLVIAEFRGTTHIVPTGRTYDQRYIGVFQIDDDGKIALFREYFDPTVFVEAFALPSVPALDSAHER
ncbi:nuclear transport factor 2 family protein [Qipengyuania qiaonensis]|uniref:Nuclear transport factor 2 family protein n=1 Tax=Qipengyuania qiaonensis TaxID=2867240 RepID=A0ABS7J8F7_9SPHN|nr:nuclear transport factor 2 family protein [Qipengyuania qiaonensis]MBX7482159.1 nuclear transport factor 2 family protein [Qipengyuania qiaonensis]